MQPVRAVFPPEHARVDVRDDQIPATRERAREHPKVAIPPAQLLAPCRGIEPRPRAPFGVDGCLPLAREPDERRYTEQLFKLKAVRVRVGVGGLAHCASKSLSELGAS